MASKKKTKKAKKAKKSGGTSRKPRKLAGAALKKHQEKLAREGKSASPKRKLKAPRPPGAKTYRLGPPTKKPATATIAHKAKKAADELAQAAGKLKKLEKAAKKIVSKSRRRKFGKRQKAAAKQAFAQKHGGLSPEAYLRKKRGGPKKARAAKKSTERRVTAKEILAKPGTKAAAKLHTSRAASLTGKKLHVWLCAGQKRAGCGGGKKGGHVIGMLR